MAGVGCVASSEHDDPAEVERLELGRTGEGLEAEVDLVAADEEEAHDAPDLDSTTPGGEQEPDPYPWRRDLVEDDVPEPGPCDGQKKAAEGAVEPK